MAAGNAIGIWNFHQMNMSSTKCDTFVPEVSQEERNLRYARWLDAVKRTLGWEYVQDKNEN